MSAKVLPFRTHAAPPPEDYSVEQYPGVNGTVNLVGRDGRGEIMLEMRIARANLTHQLVGRLIQFARECVPPTTEAVDPP